ncbi:hypothetical protein [Chitinophaga japonensis]|uniref:Uncharacterized protein n=1 Tax=Chitinophaga japonensis TaxID=104662 RepID=A0A562SSH3_CHIJA|nr:hypothetical protein [Chitinophaga japonensis]TWI84058.1 hypothetical protein LX66_4420 [Chitinophaga japonensis]
MLRSLAFVTCVLGIAGCMETSAGDTARTTDIDSDRIATASAPRYTAYRESGEQTISIDSALYAHLQWANALIHTFVKYSDNPMVQYALQDHTLEWRWDRLQTTDTAAYLVVQLTHTIDDEDGRRAVTDGWIYVDTLTRVVYEYDLPNDSLLLLAE